MNRAALESLIRRNADACESSTSSRCRCACGGEFHGQKHSEQWIADTLEFQIERADELAAERGELL